jgi:hypothetical protein
MILPPCHRCQPPCLIPASPPCPHSANHVGNISIHTADHDPAPSPNHPFSHSACLSSTPSTTSTMSSYTPLSTLASSIQIPLTSVLLITLSTSCHPCGHSCRISLRPHVPVSHPCVPVIPAPGALISSCPCIHYGQLERWLTGQMQDEWQSG